MTRRILFVCLAGFLLSPLPALASLYVGAGIGNSWYTHEMEVEEIGSAVKDVSDTSTGKIFGGYNSDSFLSVEGGYRDLGEIKQTVTGTSTTSMYDSRTKGWDAEAMGRIQISIVDIFGKAGAFFWNTKGNYVDESGTAFLWGVGAGVHLGAIGVRLEWESMEVKNPDGLTMLTLGATLGF